MKIIYKELDEISNLLAYYLCSRGRVNRNDIIPIICDLSQYSIIRILGISKAGGAFQPMDKNLPNKRIQFILREINSKLILLCICKDIIVKLQNNEKHKKHKMCDLIKYSYSNSCNKINNINEFMLCYVLLTSGNTGKLK
eukprot:jgi/Orpsp1_1/1182961/evm.model.c7180000083306.1